MKTTQLAKLFLKAAYDMVEKNQLLLPLVAETIGAEPLHVYYLLCEGSDKATAGVCHGGEWSYCFHGAECDIEHTRDKRFTLIEFGPGGRYDVFSGWGVLQYIMASQSPWPLYPELKEFFGSGPHPQHHLNGKHDRMCDLTDILKERNYLEPCDKKLLALREKHRPPRMRRVASTSAPPRATR